MDHLQEFRKNIINQYPTCRKCDKKYPANIVESILIVGFNPSIDKWYTEHRKCNPTKTTWTMQPPD